jgi:glutathione synthase/RimK-type ligase-like ATP-grasp enzyme
MIVLWGLMEDGPLAAVHEELRSSAARFLHVDQRRGSEYLLELEDCRGAGVLTGPETNLRLDDVTAVYARPYNFADLDIFDGVDPSAPPMQRAARFEEAMTSWCDLTGALVVNRPSNMGSNASKPYQLELIRQCGFRVPQTLLTTDPECVLAFQRKHRRIIFKSISGWRSIVQQLRKEDVSSLDDVDCCPTQFQEYVEGTDYRVQVLDGDVFGYKISSSGDDYRYSGDAVMEEVRLDERIKKRCIGLCKSLDLVFAGVDLRHTPEGHWCCFEVNPSPGFTYFEKGARNVARSLASLLASAQRR